MVKSNNYWTRCSPYFGDFFSKIALTGNCRLSGGGSGARRRSVLCFAVPLLGNPRAILDNRRTALLCPPPNFADEHVPPAHRRTENEHLRIPRAYGRN